MLRNYARVAELRVKTNTLARLSSNGTNKISQTSSNGKKTNLSEFQIKKSIPNPRRERSKEAIDFENQFKQKAELRELVSSLFDQLLGTKMDTDANW